MIDQPYKPITGRQAPALVEAHNTISAALGRMTRDEAWQRKICMTCQQPVDPTSAFKDDVSRREYFITAECQVCQDATWASFGDDE